MAWFLPKRMTQLSYLSEISLFRSFYVISPNTYSIRFTINKLINEDCSWYILSLDGSCQYSYLTKSNWISYSNRGLEWIEMRRYWQLHNPICEVQILLEQTFVELYPYPLLVSPAPLRLSSKMLRIIIPIPYYSFRR